MNCAAASAGEAVFTRRPADSILPIRGRHALPSVPRHPHPPSTLTEEIDQLLNDGNVDEALATAEQLVHRKQQRVAADDPSSLDDYADALEIRGNVHQIRGDLAAARQDYQSAIDQVPEDEGEYSRIGRLHASLGSVCHLSGDIQDAAHHWQIAIRFFENHSPPLLLDVATIANNLGFLYKSSGDLDSAENCYLRSLEVLHSQLGQQNEQTATVCCNLGSLYHQAGFHEQSCKMHETALKTRNKLLGRSHPDTAQSHNNIALSLIEAGRHDEAREHFEQALKTFESLSEEFAEDLDAVCSNYSDFLRGIGEDAKADEVAARGNPS